MSKVWPQATIRELIALAETQGQSRAELASEREAELFRFAIYNFRREHEIGNDITIALDGNVVTLNRKPQVAILQADEIMT